MTNRWTLQREREEQLSLGPYSKNDFHTLDMLMVECAYAICNATFTFFPSSATILLVVWSANGDSSAFTFKASSMVNVLSYDTH